MRKLINSGTEWLGMIPEEWSIERTKYHFYNEKTIVGMLKVSHIRRQNRPRPSY